jgi:peptide chain release factor 3
MSFLEEIARRRTFGIISHPDAGKTTLTEKLLLFGGAIQEAGAVKSNKIKKSATSDFMEIERQRGISVATSVLAFHYKDKKINILDTPGHKDFAEDTFRTLTAVDSVIVVIDVAKGVEEQTKKLVEVCRMRNIPIIVFINKLDREGKDAFDLLDEVEQKLGFTVTPLSFPIGMGYDFQGIYNLWGKRLRLFNEANKTRISDAIDFDNINDPSLSDHIGDTAANLLREEIELVTEVYPSFDREAYLAGQQQPVFFGSALNNFGVQELLDAFIEIAPQPLPKHSAERLVDPKEDAFSGFVFKIHANMDPKHRDRLAFIKIVSGTFTGNFKIGDTLTAGETLHFSGVPSFSPEHFRYINNADPMKAKQLAKGIDQLMDEGVAQLFTLDLNGRKVIGTVGALQFEVIQYRLEHEYGAKCTYENLNVFKACWVETQESGDADFKNFTQTKAKFLAKDKEGQLVFLADSAFSLQMTKDKYPQIAFHASSEF